MKNSTIAIFSSIIIIALLALIFIFWFKGKKETPIDEIQAIPTNSSIIIRINNYHRFTETLRKDNQLWETLKNFSSIYQANQTVGYIDNLCDRSTVINSLFTQNPIFLSLNAGNDGKIGFLAVAQIPESINKKDLINLINFNPNDSIPPVKVDYNGEDVYSFLNDSSSHEILSISCIKGLVICSSSNELLKQSINQIKDGVSLTTNPSFSKIALTAGTKVDANVFINNARLPLMLSKFINSNFQQGFTSLSDIAQWSELDVSIKNDAFFLNGFTQTAEKPNSFLGIFSRQQPVETKITSVIPSETASFVCLGISDLYKFLEDYRLYLDKNDKILEYTSTLSDIKKELGVDLQELYNNFFGKEIALVYTSFSGVEFDNCWFVTVKTRGQSQAKQYLLETIENYAKSKGQKISNYKSTLKIDSEKSWDIYKFPIKGINSALFGSLFSGVSDEYFTFIDNYIVFGNSCDALSRFIQSNIRNNQLQLDISFRQFSNALTSSSNYFFYLNPRLAGNLFSQFLSDQYSGSFIDNHNALTKIQGLAVQLNGGNNMIFNNICLQYSPFSTEEPETTWETRLDTAFTMMPQLVINHITKNQEILVQDLKYRLYLINDVGRIIWSKQLPEPIIGGITQVDLFKNHKLQYLFNTRSFLFAIDRKGSFVDGFPVKFKSKATNPVAVFDYDNNLDYRFVVASQDLKVNVYNSVGKSISGWSFKKTEQPVTVQIQHFKVKDKDYIVFADRNRPYFLDRKGEERVSIKKLFSKSTNNKFYLDEGNKKHTDRLVTTDSIGLIKYIYFNGNTEDLAIKAFSSNHTFDYQDVDLDGTKEFLFLDKSELFVYKQNKSLLFLYKFDTEISPSILTFNITNTLHLNGFTSLTNGKLYLLTGSGSLYNGFPLVGCSPFNICKFSGSSINFNVLTGSSTGRLLNYSVK